MGIAGIQHAVTGLSCTTHRSNRVRPIESGAINFSFDRQTNDMYIGDVGQRLWEEVNFEPANTAGVNYGWSCREGAHNFVGGSTCVSASTDPILEYDHNNSRCSITGGYVYRGQVTAFNGYYFYADPDRR